MKKIYYTVDLNLEQIDGNINNYESVNGLKCVYMYSIENNELESIDDLEIDIENDTEKEIQNYLNDNGKGDEKFEFVLL